MKILGPDAQKKNLEYLILNNQKLEERKKKDVLNLYMVRNQNVLLILSRKKIKVLHFKWIKNVSKHENN